VVLVSKHAIDTKTNVPKCLFGVLVQPITQYQLLNTVSLAITQYNHQKQLEKEVAHLKETIESRKIIERITEGKGGIIWHTQGSGKSLTMTYTALKLRRMEKISQTNIENPCILIVTDRTDLDDQISGTFTNCNFPNPVQVEGVEHLKEELQSPLGKTLFTNIQKFQTNKGEQYPELSKSSNIIVFVDEAHRTQYKDLALNMRTAIPNAHFIGFTGTPIDKEDKSTIKVFGTYIDKYLPKQSIADGATVQIKYQARLPNVHVISSELDVKFDDFVKKWNDQGGDKILTEITDISK